MSDGLKTGLILGGAGLVGLLLWQRSQAQAAGLTTISGTGVPNSLTAAPGVAPGVTPPASSGGSGSTLKTVAKLAAAPVYYPTKAVVAGAEYAYNKVSSWF